MYSFIRLRERELMMGADLLRPGGKACVCIITVSEFDESRSGCELQNIALLVEEITSKEQA